MFTGIIEEIGVIKNIHVGAEKRRFTISAQKILPDLEIDHSVAVNGVCLTVVHKDAFSFSADAVAETLHKTTLGISRVSDRVNLERALRLTDRLGGHLVQGHVDGTGKIKSLISGAEGATLELEIPTELGCYTIAKGSIAIDGVSLTIAEKSNNLIKLALIPHSLNQTIFQFKRTGDSVNIEVDFFAKYIEQFLNKSGETKISQAWLKQQGF